MIKERSDKNRAKSQQRKTPNCRPICLASRAYSDIIWAPMGLASPGPPVLQGEVRRGLMESVSAIDF